MSSLGEIGNALARVAPQALAGYTGGQARGEQFQLQQQARLAQQQGLQQYRQRLLDLQQQGNRLKQDLAERAADQKELGRLTDALLKSPHDLQARGQLEPTLLQWAGLFHKVHPGEALPSFFGERFVPAGERTSGAPVEEVPLPRKPDVVQSWPLGTDAPPFPPTPARPTRALPGAPGVDVLPGPYRPGAFVKARLPAHFEGIPEIPLDALTAERIAASQALTGYRGKRGELTDEQILRQRTLLEPDLNRRLAEIALLQARAKDVPAARKQADERLRLMAEALQVNKDRLGEYIRNNFYGNQVAYAQFMSQDEVRQAQVARLRQQLAQEQTRVPPALWKELQPLFRGYFQTDPVLGGYLSEEDREPYRQAILARYREHGLDYRWLLKPGEPGYAPAYALPGDGRLPESEEAPGAAAPAAPPGQGGPPALPPAAVPAGALGAVGPVPSPAALRGQGASAAAALPAGPGSWHTDPDELQPIGDMARWQLAAMGSDPLRVEAPPMPKGEQFTGGELDRVNRAIMDGSFPRRLRNPKARPVDRERLLRAYWLLRGRPYRGP